MVLAFGEFEDAREEAGVAFPDWRVLFVLDILPFRREKNGERKLSLKRNL